MFGASRVRYAVWRLIAIGWLMVSPVGMFVSSVASPLVELVGLVIAPGGGGDLLRLPGPVIQFIRFSSPPTPCEGVIQPLVPLLPFSIKTVVQVLHLLQLSTVLRGKDVLPPHRDDLLADIRLVWYHGELRKCTSEQPSSISLTDRPGPRVSGGAPASFSLGVDGGWADHDRILLWLAPRFAPPVVLWIGVRCGIFVRLHGLAMGGGCGWGREMANVRSKPECNPNPWLAEFGRATARSGDLAEKILITVDSELPA